MEAERVAEHLYSNRALSTEQYERIQQESNVRRDKANKILDYITRGSETDFRQLIAALESCEQGHLARLLH